MHGNVREGREAATIGNGSPAAQESTNGKSAVDDADWFSESVQQLHPESPGKVLHYTTALGDVRLCQRYASGEVKPPAYFLRRLLRGKQGRQWLFATMDGCTESWWVELQRDAELGRKVRALRD